MTNRHFYSVLLYSLLIFFSVGSAVVVSLFLTQQNSSPYLSVSILLVFISSLLIAYPWIRALSNGQSLIQPATIYSATSAGYVFGAIFLISGGQSRSLRYILTPENLPVFTFSLFVVVVGLASYLTSYYLTLGKRTYDFSIDDDIVNDNHSGLDLTKRKIVLIALAITIGIGLIGYWLFVRSSGGVANIAQNIHSRTLLRTTDYYRLFFQFLQASTYLWFIFDKAAFKKIPFLLLLLLNLYTMITLGSAAPIILFVFFLMAIWNSYKRPIQNPLNKLPRWLLQGGLVLAFIFVLLIGRIGWRDASVVARHSVSTDLNISLIVERTTSYGMTEVFSSVFGGANLASIESLSRIVDAVPTKLDYLYGQTFYWTTLSPIPRALWPEKPVTTIGLYLKHHLENSNAVAGGVPASWLGELYLNGGLLGVVVGQLLFGYFSARVLQWFYVNNNNRFARLHYINFVVIFTFYITKTEFKTALNRGAGFGVAFILVHFLLKNYVNIGTKLASHRTAKINFFFLENLAK